MGEKGDRSNLFKAFKLRLEESETEKELEEKQILKKKNKLASLIKLGLILSLTFTFRFVYYIFPKKEEEKNSKKIIINKKDPVSIIKVEKKLNKLKEAVKKEEKEEKLVEIREEVVAIYKETNQKHATTKMKQINKESEKEILNIDKKLEAKNPAKKDEGFDLGKVVVPVLACVENVVSVEKKVIKDKKSEDVVKKEKYEKKLKDIEYQIKETNDLEKIERLIIEAEKINKEIDKEKDMTDINDKYKKFIKENKVIKVADISTIDSKKIKNISKTLILVAATQTAISITKKAINEEEIKNDNKIKEENKCEEKKEVEKLKIKLETKKIDNDEDITNLDTAVDMVDCNIIKLGKEEQTNLDFRKDTIKRNIKSLLNSLSLNRFLFINKTIRSLVNSLMINNAMRSLRRIKNNDIMYLNIQSLREINYTKNQIKKLTARTFENALFQIDSLKTEIMFNYNMYPEYRSEFEEIRKDLQSVETFVYNEINKVNIHNKKLMKMKSKYENDYRW